ncbi:MAG: hypothetical protein RLZZ15_4195, partial [Verrucomicrobiota bacterium]
MNAARAQRRTTEPPAFALVEEAVHLLRGAAAGTWAVYFAGTVPFGLGVLFFWAHTTWFQPTAGDVAWGALGLAILFTLMKAGQT